MPAREDGPFSYQFSACNMQFVEQQSRSQQLQTDS
jgi:hypothetical protein